MTAVNKRDPLLLCLNVKGSKGAHKHLPHAVSVWMDPKLQSTTSMPIDRETQHFCNHLILLNWVRTQRICFCFWKTYFEIMSGLQRSCKHMTKEFPNATKNAPIDFARFPQFYLVYFINFLSLSFSPSNPPFPPSLSLPPLNHFEDKLQIWCPLSP